MIKRLQSDELKYTHASKLNFLQGNREPNLLSDQLAIESDVVIKLHYMTRSLQPNEASQLRAIADALASKLKSTNSSL